MIHDPPPPRLTPVIARRHAEWAANKWVKTRSARLKLLKFLRDNQAMLDRCVVPGAIFIPEIITGILRCTLPTFVYRLFLTFPPRKAIL